MAGDTNIRDCAREKNAVLGPHSPAQAGEHSGPGSGSLLQKPSDLVMTVPEAISFRQTNQNAQKVEIGNRMLLLLEI